MRRRGFFGSLLSFALPQVSVSTVPDTHAHVWVKGPFYIQAAISLEEPGFYPPQGLMRTEHCRICGILRLPEDMWKQDGDQLGVRP